MENIKDYILGFLAGTVDHKEFVATCLKDPSILDWIQERIPAGRTYTTHRVENGEILSETIPYDIRVVFRDYYRCRTGSIGMYLDIQGTIKRNMKLIFPDEEIYVSPMLSDRYSFMLHACPEYIGGKEVEELCIFEKIYDELPQELSKTKKIKLFREKLKEVFPRAGKGYPMWVQEAEWPVSNGKPMKYISQKVNMFAISYYTFEDVDTGEQRVIEQFT